MKTTGNTKRIYIQPILQKIEIDSQISLILTSSVDPPNDPWDASPYQVSPETLDYIFSQE